MNNTSKMGKAIPFLIALLILIAVVLYFIPEISQTAAKTGIGGSSVPGIGRDDLADLLGTSPAQVVSWEQAGGESGEQAEKTYIVRTLGEETSYCKKYRDARIELKYTGKRWQRVDCEYGPWYAEWKLNGTWREQTSDVNSRTVHLTATVDEATSSSIRLSYQFKIDGQEYTGSGTFTLSENQSLNDEFFNQTAVLNSSMPGWLDLSNQYGLRYALGSYGFSSVLYADMVRADAPEADSSVTGPEEYRPVENSVPENDTNSAGNSFLPDGQEITPALTLSPDEQVESDRICSLFYSFMERWSANNLDDMLTLCAPSWRGSVANSRTELFALLANKTPLKYQFQAISGSDAAFRTVEFTAEIDRNNGKQPATYWMYLDVVKENGQWYADPRSLSTYSSVTTE